MNIVSNPRRATGHGNFWETFVDAAERDPAGLKRFLQLTRNLKLGIEGEEVMSQDRCVNCGRPLEINARFCDGCGQAVRIRIAPEAPGTPPMRELPAPPQPPLVARPRPWVVAAVLLIVGLAVGFGIGGAVFSGTRTTATLTQHAITTSVSTIQPQDILEVCYSPGGNCASRIVYWIGRANSSVHILVYSFTLDTIGDALIQARQRKPGLDIKIVWDETGANGTGSEFSRLRTAGIEMRIDRRTNLMHNKVAIIDQRITVTGSFNWSDAANRTNRENLIVLDNITWAAAYEQQFQVIYAASVACDPSYPTVCIPPPPPKLSCSDIPYRNFIVLVPDPHGFDGDRDGFGCET